MSNILVPPKFPIHVKNWNELIAVFGDPVLRKDSKGVLRVSAEWEANHLVLITTPLSLPKRVYCHKRLAPILSAVFDDIYNQGAEELIHSWDGCFNPRYIFRKDGILQPSSHTFAVSVDVNAFSNPMGVSWEENLHPKKQHPELIAIFKKHGMLFGNDFKRPDPMHFSLVYW